MAAPFSSSSSSSSGHSSTNDLESQQSTGDAESSTTPLLSFLRSVGQFLQNFIPQSGDAESFTTRVRAFMSIIQVRVLGFFTPQAGDAESTLSFLCRTVGQFLRNLIPQRQIAPAAVAPLIPPNPPDAATPLLTRFIAFAYTILASVYASFHRSRCEFVIGFLIYNFVGVLVFLGFQVHTNRNKLGDADFSGTNGTFIDAAYFSVVSLSSIGFGDIYPSSTPAVIFVSIYIYLGLLLFSVVSVICSGGLMTMVENYLMRLCVRVCVGVQEGAAIQAGWPYREMRIMLNFVLSVMFTLLLSLRSSLYVAVSAVTTVGYGNQSFDKQGDRLYALFMLFPAVLVYARLASLVGEYFGTPRQN